MQQGIQRLDNSQNYTLAEIAAEHNNKVWALERVKLEICLTSPHINKLDQDLVYSALVNIILKTLDSLNIALKMSNDQIAEFAQDLMDNYYTESLEDFALAFKNGRMGKWDKPNCQIYNRIDSTIFLAWLREHLEEKAQLREATRNKFQISAYEEPKGLTQTAKDVLADLKEKLRPKHEIKPEPKPEEKIDWDGILESLNTFSKKELHDIEKAFKTRLANFGYIDEKTAQRDENYIGVKKVLESIEILIK